jgi:PPOX class probable F420-dependent enzyme
VPTTPTFTDLGDAKFVSLTTFRRSGERVPTPVWIARDGDALVVSTPEGSGKVKRLRHNARVEMVPCSRRGRVDEGAEPVAGMVEMFTEPQDRERLTAGIRRKYGLEFRIVMAIERLLRSGQTSRVLLRITPV